MNSWHWFIQDWVDNLALVTKQEDKMGRSDSTYSQEAICVFNIFLFVRIYFNVVYK